ncbi:TonB-dependent receptor [Brevundimonas sp.]|uniref:TonB-dependent receptor n=1 Tax=Brevundimonas sp. TaxID=1871086 RepID=UPI0035B16110
MSRTPGVGSAFDGAIVMPSVYTPARAGRLRAATAACALLGATMAGLALPQAALAQSAQGSIEGRVSDQQAGAFFEGAQVEIIELGRRAVTGPDGRYQFTGVPNGSYTLRTSYLGAPTTETRIDVLGATQADVRLGADVTTLDNILVIGQRANLASAINQKRNASNIISGVTSDFVGQFPDQNVTEAAQRIPGVSINRDQGEGRFISIRGANPNLNAITINGVGVPSAEGDQRQVALDVIPAELIDTLTVTKSLTPDIDGDSIGGAVNIESATAFDRAGFSGSLTAEGSYNDLRGEWSPRLSGSASDIFDVGTGQLGIAGSISYFDRELGSDGIENGDGELDEVDGVAFPVTAEPRDYVLARTRFGAAVNFDWRPDANNDLYLRTFYSDFADDEVQGGTLFEPDTDDGGNVVSASGNTVLLANQEVESYVSDRKETQTILSLAAGGESRFGATTVEYQLAYAEAGEENPDYIEFIFVGDFSDSGALVGTNLDDPRRPLIVTDDLATFNDASLYELDEAIFESGVTEDTEWSGRVDVRHDMNFGENPGFVKFGAKARLRDKMADLNVDVYGGADQDFTVADFLNPDIDYPLGLIAPQADPKAVAAAIRANQAAFDEDFDEEGSFIDSNVEDYDVTEDVFASYGMGSVDIGALTLVGGVRVEHTEYAAQGNQITLDEEAGTLELVPIDVEDSYTDVLPSLNARYELNDDVVLRAAYFRSVVRPILEQNRPAGLIEINDEGEIEAEFGNTALERYKADSVDLAIEYYPGGVGLLTAGVFFKNIQNPVFGVDLAGQDGFEGFDAYETFINGDDATVMGFETAWQQDLTFLPSPLDGLLISANYTFVDTESSIPLPDGGSRDIALPFQARHTANLSLGYEKYGFSGRVAVAYRDRILDSIGDPEDAAFDVYIDDHVQVDVTAAYQVTPMIQVFVEGTNLNDEPLYSYSGTRNVNVQYEEYGPSWTLGLKAVF